MKRRMWARTRLIVGLGLLSLPLLLYADVCVYNVPEVRLMRGVIVDSSKRPIPGVTVSLRRDGEIIAAAITDGAGRFAFDSLPEGAYEVRASMPGFQTGQYKVTLAHNAASWKRNLRITLAVGMPHCGGNIEVIKAPKGSQH